MLRFPFALQPLRLRRSLPDATAPQLRRPPPRARFRRNRRTSSTLVFRRRARCDYSVRRLIRRRGGTSSPARSEHARARVAGSRSLSVPSFPNGPQTENY